MLRAADLTPELVDAATEALLMSHRKFSETCLEAMRFTIGTRHAGSGRTETPSRNPVAPKPGIRRFW